MQHTYSYKKIWFPLQLILFQSPQPDVIIFGDFKLKKTFNKATNST